MKRADRLLVAREAFGLCLGLERMLALTAELGEPQRAFRSAHVVGTNGKSSVCAMAEAALGSHGVRTGTSVSPHLWEWAERVTIAGEPAPGIFDAAVEQAEQAALRVEAGLPAGERITQFELATAAAFLALAESGVEAALIEAGLGGRLDATNVIPSDLTVLTSVGLEHTEWLGTTEAEIAAEKLAVLRPGTALLVGPVSPQIRRQAAELAREHEAEWLDAPAPSGPGDGFADAGSPGSADSELQSRSQGTASDPDREPLSRPAADDPQVARSGPGGFRRQNLELALTAAEHLHGLLRPAEPFDRARAAEAASAVRLAGRLERRAGPPPAIFDVAHNPAGAAALRRELETIAEGRELIGCIAILAGKDASGMIEALAPALSSAILTEIPEEALKTSGRSDAVSRAPRELAGICAAFGLQAEIAADPDQALAAAAARAEQAGGTVLVTGSHYLVAAARRCGIWQD